MKAVLIAVLILVLSFVTVSLLLPTSRSGVDTGANISQPQGLVPMRLIFGR